MLFGATAAVSVVMYGITSLGFDTPGAIDLDNLSVTNSQLMLAMALGWLGAAFLSQATGLANSIAGSALTNTSAGIITAGATGIAAAMARNTTNRKNEIAQGAADMKRRMETINDNLK